MRRQEELGRYPEAVRRSLRLLLSQGSQYRGLRKGTYQEQQVVQAAVQPCLEVVEEDLKALR